MIRRDNIKKGFSLVELMVSMSIFTVIMLIVMGSIITVIESNRKAQQLRLVMDNLNQTMEGMSRLIRFGSNYHCNVASGILSDPQDCFDGNHTLGFKDINGNQVIYRITDNQITKIVGNVTYYITSPEMTIEKLVFFVNGSLIGDNMQPRVTIIVSGYTGTATKRSQFNLQTSVSQRKFDYQ